MSGIYGGTSTTGSTSRALSSEEIANMQSSENSINSAFSGFNNDWYSKRRTAYLNYAIPELTKQYGSERKSLVYGLANRGLVNSSAANEQFTNLSQALTSKEQDVVNSASTAEQNLRTQIATAKSNLMSQISTATSPSTTAQSAVSTAAGYTSPSYSNVSSNAFADFNTGLSNRYSLSNLGTTTYSTNSSGSSSSGLSSNAGTEDSSAASYTVNA